MTEYQRLLEGNRRFVEQTLRQDPDFFMELAGGQTPKVLWIGCADSRVPSELVTQSEPGDLFVHRNVANLVVHTDLNLLTVLNYAVDVLKVSHIVVCGHEGCGGVMAALSDGDHGMMDNWLRHIKDVYYTHREELDKLSGEPRLNRLIELNVLRQVEHLAATDIVQRAWAQGRSLAIHGWVYELRSGRIRELGGTIDDPGDLPSVYRISFQESKT